MTWCDLVFYFLGIVISSHCFLWCIIFRS